MFTFLDPRVWLLALALVGVSGGLGYLKGRGDGYKLGSAEVQQRWDAAEAQRREVADKAEKESRAKERKLQENANAAIARSAQRAIRARVDADAARSELERLRNVPTPDTRPDSSGSPEAACRTADDRTRAVRELLLACGTELEGLARAADGHLRDAMSAREAWPTGESK